MNFICKEDSRETDLPRCDGWLIVRDHHSLDFDRSRNESDDYRAWRLWSLSGTYQLEGAFTAASMCDPHNARSVKPKKREHGMGNYRENYPPYYFAVFSDQKTVSWKKG